MADNSNVSEINAIYKDSITFSPRMQNIIAENNVSDVILVAEGKK